MGFYCSESCFCDAFWLEYVKCRPRLVYRNSGKMCSDGLDTWKQCLKTCYPDSIALVFIATFCDPEKRTAWKQPMSLN